MNRMLEPASSLHLQPWLYKKKKKKVPSCDMMQITTTDYSDHTAAQTHLQITLVQNVSLSCQWKRRALLMQINSYCEKVQLICDW